MECHPARKTGIRPHIRFGDKGKKNPPLDQTSAMESVEGDPR